MSRKICPRDFLYKQDSMNVAENHFAILCAFARNFQFFFLRNAIKAYAIGVPNRASMAIFMMYCDNIINKMSRVVSAPTKAISTNGTVSKI